MKAIRIVSFLLIAWLNATTTQAQPVDSVFSFATYLQMIRTYHPIMREASIEVEMAKSEITKAVGSFNPVVSAELGGKMLDGIRYYSYQNPALNWPIWYGAEIVAGNEALRGDRLDASQTKGNISYVGISVPLLKDVVIDKRRAYLQQAKVMHSMAKSQQRIWINDLMLEAIEAYIKWLEAYESWKAIGDLVRVNEERVNQVKVIWRLGERAAIDTTEAITQWQSMQLLQAEYEVKFQQAGYSLSAFLWKPNYEPQLLPETVIPDAAAWVFDENSLSGLVNEFLQEVDDRHPYLQWYQQKVNWQQIDKKLKFQELLPKLNVQYNQLSKSSNWQGITNANQLFNNNYKYGIKFETPLLFSNGRASYRMAKLKLEQVKLNEVQKKIELQVKLKQYYAGYQNFKKQSSIQAQQVTNYQRLALAEESRFKQGESSLFLMNSRETKLIEGKLKQVELNAKKLKSAYSVLWASGILN